MTHEIEPNVLAESASFGDKEERLIEQQVNFEQNEMQLKMTKVGATTNIIGGLLVIWLLHEQIHFSTLITWYTVFVILNLINIVFSFAFQFCKVTPKTIGKWLKAYHWLIMPPVCFAWGIVGVISLSADLSHQFYIITLLFSVLICFSLGTITDFVASVISIAGLLLPSLLVRLYIGMEELLKFEVDRELNFGISICFLILGIFLLIACYIGYKLIRKSITLSYINATLNKKLENMNKFLEQRVRDRTKQLEKSLKQVTYQATHDLLTNLPNQRLLIEYLKNSITQSNEKNHMFGIVCLSINEIDRINDSMGHHVGDFVIQRVATRLKEIFSNGKYILSEKTEYKFSLSRKDVFVILVEPVHDYKDIEPKITELFAAIEEPIVMNKHTIKITASLGVSLYPRDGKNTNKLLMNADAAMILAKRRGGNAYHIYETKINADIYDQLQLEGNLHAAVKNGEFILQYQPIIDLKTNKICEVEALVRWKHPTRGFVPPIDFIPLAEANGLILPLGEWVLHTACKQLAEWHAKGFNELKVAVNLSAKQLDQKNILDVIVNVLKETKLPAEFLELELTESEAFKSEVIDILQGFKKLGLCLAIDDFGTGYSGLSNIKQFTIDKLKIDKSFVQDLENSKDSMAIVTNVVALSKSIGVKVLAEGVENEQQLNILKEKGCDFIQGYYFSRPLAAGDLLELLQSGRVFR